MSEVENKFSFTEDEIRDVNSSINSAPADGYGSIQKNKKIYTTAFNKLMKKTADKLNTAASTAEANANAYTDEQIANFGFVEVVSVLPETGLPNKIYAVTKTDTDTNDLYDEYIWVNGAWEYQGSKKINIPDGILEKEYIIGRLVAEIGTVGHFYTIIPDTWNFAEEPIDPKFGVIYYDLLQNKYYRWVGRAFLELAVLPTEPVNMSIAFFPDNIAADKQLDGEAKKKWKDWLGVDDSEEVDLTEIEKANERQDAELNGDVTIVELVLSENSPLAIQFKGLTADKVTVDWGDSTIEYYTKPSDESTVMIYEHIYSMSGNYIVKIYGVRSIDSESAFGANSTLYGNQHGVRSIKLSNKIVGLADKALQGLPYCSELVFGLGITKIPTMCCSGMGSEVSQNTKIQIPDTVTEIGLIAFSYVSKLKEIKIPSSVTKIYYGAFYTCYSLKYVTMESTTPPYISFNGSVYNIFEKTALERIIIKNATPEILEAYKTAQYWSNYASLIDGLAYQSDIEELQEQIDDIKSNINESTETGIVLTPSANSEYYYSELEYMYLAFETANLGDMFYITFKSGSTATVLTVDGTNAVFDDFVPSENSYIEIMGKWNGEKWIVLFNQTSVGGAV